MDRLFSRHGASVLPDPGPWTCAEPKFPYREEVLQFIWGAGLYDGRDLHTVEGKKVEVIAPGVVQHNSGPDLRDAMVRIDGQVWAGQVEVHVRSREWDVHGHQHDPAYDNVILHVVHTMDRPVHCANGREVPTVELADRIAVEDLDTMHHLMTSKSSVPCAKQLPGPAPAILRSWSEELLKARLARRSETLLAQYHATKGDLGEVLHRLLLRAMGTRVNAEPFALLGRILPLRLLARYHDDAFRMEALLFGQAGLLEGPFAGDHPERLRLEYRSLAHLHRLEPMRQGSWCFSGVRPLNFPTIRLAQYADLLAACAGDPLVLLEPSDPLRLREQLRPGVSAYWHTHYRFDERSRPARKRAGPAMADRIIHNAIVPALILRGHVHGRPALRNRALELLKGLPPERNGILEQWAALGLKAGNAAEGQALLELRSLYCDRRKCLFCRVGRELLSPGCGREQ